MRTLVYMLSFAVGFVAAWFVRGFTDVSDGIAPVTDTVTVVDTVPYLVPVPRDSMVLRYETVRLQIADTSRVTVTDTVRVADSVSVVVPITQKIYTDSLYRAYVSGYRPSLDSIFIYGTTRQVTTVVVKEKKHRWGFGIQAGYGYGGSGFAPYIGIGASYNFITF